MTTLTLHELRTRVGQQIAASEWFEMSQERINSFADATDDHQWIHVDVVRARANTPFHSTIAHGFLTLSLVSAMMRSAVTISGLRMTLNYGLNRVRFVAPVRAGSQVRARVVLKTIEDTADSVQATWDVSVECDGADKPCLVAEWLVRYYPTHSEHEVRHGQDHEGG